MNGPFSRTILPAVFLLLFVGFGWWLIHDARESAFSRHSPTRKPSPSPARIVDTPNAAPKRAHRQASKTHESLQDLLFGIPNERLVRFATDEAYQNFLAGLDGSGLRLLGRLDRFRALRIGFDNLADLESLLGDDEELSTNYMVSIPQLPDVAAQPGAVGFGNSTLQWLGISGDNSTWGEGVKIAVLDTGVTSHAALPGGIPEIDLVTLNEPVPVNGHGTAVASLIAGEHGASQGIAPAAELISIRIGDESGASNSFLLAEGITLAVEQGAQLINISMGSYGDSALVREAVSHAVDNGVLIIASSGNQGFSAPTYPAAYEGVIAVGAVDAGSDHLNFSNHGSTLDAPGYSMNAAWPGDEFILFTGTSASAPIVTGAIAATISNQDLSPARAYELVVENLNEAGAPGTDPLYGEGILNVGRITNTGVPGIYDAAAASNYFQPATPEDPVNRVLVTVENRGTELLTNTQVDITIPNGTYQKTIPSLSPGQTRTISLPANIPTITEDFLVQSSVNITGNLSDTQPNNNELTTKVILTSASGSDQ